MIKSAEQILKEIGKSERRNSIRVPGRTCEKVPGCKKPYHGEGYCKGHYNKWFRHGDPLFVRNPRVRTIEPCREAWRGCPNLTGKSGSAKGWCDRCYDRWHKHGDPWYHTPLTSHCNKTNCFQRVLGLHD